MTTATPSRGAHPGRRLASRAGRTLRAPGVVVAEIVAIAAAIAVSTVIPQAAADPGAWGRLVRERPALGRAARALGLENVVGAPWFLLLVCLAGVSLALVVGDLGRRVARTWRTPPDPEQFGAAPLRAEWTRPRATGPRLRIRTEGRLGDLGSPLFHLGLLAVIVAGLGQMLFGAQAFTELVEGDLLPAGSAGWSAQWPGRLAAPVALPAPLRLLRVDPEHHGSGALSRLAADVTLGGAPRRLAINAPLRVGWTLVYVKSYGPAIYLELAGGGDPIRRMEVLDEADGGFHGVDALPDGSTVDLRVRPLRPGEPDGGVEVRLVKGPVVQFVGRLAPGAEVALPDGRRLSILAVRRWARFTAARDPAEWLALGGFVLVLAGVTLMLAVVRVDELVWVREEGEEERVVVALRPRRFVPLYRERFERRVADEREAPR